MQEVFSSLEAYVDIVDTETGNVAAVGFVQNFSLDVLRQVVDRRRAGSFQKTVYVLGEDYEGSIGVLHADQRLFGYIRFRVLFGSCYFGQQKFGSLANKRTYNLRLVFDNDETGQREEYLLTNVEFKEYGLSFTDNELVLENIKFKAGDLF